MQLRAEIQSSLKYDLQKFSDVMLKETAYLIEKVVTDTEIAATRDLRIEGGLPSFISIDKKITDKGLTGEVGVLGDEVIESGKSSVSNIAAYIEFGTGLFAKELLAGYPKWIQEIAWKYYVSGKGTLKSRPYLFNNFLKFIGVFERELKKLMDKENE